MVKQIRKVSVGNSQIRDSGKLSLIEVQDSAISALEGMDFKELYRTLDIDNGNKSVDTALKTVLAEKLAESVMTADSYAKRHGSKHISASTVLIAAQEGRW